MAMTFGQYQELATRTANQRLTARDQIAAGAMGLAGESGEVVDRVKKWLYQGHARNDEALAEELGDVLWYLAHLASACGLSLDAIACGNLAKLDRRYPDGFDPAASQDRSENQ